MKNTTSTTTAAEHLAHADWCRAERIERTDHPDRGITTTRCCDCGAHVGIDAAGRPFTAPAVTGALSGVRRDDTDAMRATGGDAA